MPQGDPFPNGFPAGYRSKAGGVKYYSLQSKFAADRTLVDSFLRRIKDANRRAEREAREYERETFEKFKAKLNRPLSSFGPRRVQNSPSMGNPGNGTSDTYVGDGAPTNRKGKGRSLKIGDVLRQSAEYQPFDDPARRIGSLGGRPGQAVSNGGGALFSNWNENKANGGGVLGASASRFRGMKNVIMNPAAFMSRFALFYIAKQVTEAITEWRGWDKVSWQQSNAQATKTLSDHHKGRHQLEDVFIAGGNVVGGAGELIKPFATLGMFSGPALIIAGIRGENVEAQAAQGTSLMGDVTKWLGRGGPFGFAASPFSAAATWNRDAPSIVGKEQDSLEAKALGLFHKWTLDNVTRHQDDKRILAVGGVDVVHGALKGQSQNYKQEMKVVGQAARASLDVTKFQADWMNRFMEDKRSVGYR